MHRLHAQNLVVALFVIEHGGGEVVEHIIGRERSIRLFNRLIIVVAIRIRSATTVNLDPFVPDEKSVTEIVWWMEVVTVHG
jgi:hypothetical protein